MRGRLGQVADRPHQVRGGAGRADQRDAGPPPPRPAADDRHRDAEPEARPARTARSGSAPRPGPGSMPSGRPSPAGGGQRVRLRRHELPRRARGLRARPDAGRPGSAIRDWPAELLAWRPPTAGPAPRPWIDSPSSSPRASRVPLCGPGAHALADRASTPRLGADPGDRRHLARRPVRQAGDRPRCHRGRRGRARRSARGLLSRNGRPSAARKSRSCSRARGRSPSACCGELAVDFDEVRDAFEEFDAALLGLRRAAASARWSSRRRPSTTRRDATRPRALQATEVAQPAIGAASVGLLATALATGPDAGHGRRAQLRRAGRAPRGRRAGPLAVSPSSPRSGAGSSATRPASGPARWRRLLTGPEIAAELIAGVPGVLHRQSQRPRADGHRGRPRGGRAGVLERAECEGDPRPHSCPWPVPSTRP